MATRVHFLSSVVLLLFFLLVFSHHLSHTVPCARSTDGRAHIRCCPPPLSPCAKPNRPGPFPPSASALIEAQTQRPRPRPRRSQLPGVGLAEPGDKVLFHSQGLHVVGVALHGLPLHHQELACRCCGCGVYTDWWLWVHACRINQSIRSSFLQKRCAIHQPLERRERRRLTEIPAEILGDARRRRGLRLEPAVELVGRRAVHVQLRTVVWRWWRLVCEHGMRGGATSSIQLYLFCHARVVDHHLGTFPKTGKVTP